MRIWLICLSQNARLTVGTVMSLKVARAAVSGVAAMKATRIKPTTEPASVSNHQQIRYFGSFDAMLASRPL